MYFFELLEFLGEERRKTRTRPCEESTANGVMKEGKSIQNEAITKTKLSIAFFSLFLFNNIENISERKGQCPC